MILDTFAENRHYWATIARSLAADFAYRCMSAMRTLSPYLFTIAFVLLQSPTAHAAATSPETFVQQNIDKGYAILNDTALTPKERGDQFRALLLSIVDAKRVALFALGPYAHGASGSQINNFVGAFSDYVAEAFERDLDSNPGETITVTGSTARAPDDVIVTGKLLGVARAKGAPVNIAFRVRKNAGGGEAIVDLQVEGVSMALVQRDDFSGYLQQHGGNVATLAAELESRARHLRTGSSVARMENPA
jgi:phospholipid transport system substrate-binding protein